MKTLMIISIGFTLSVVYCLKECDPNRPERHACSENSVYCLRPASDEFICVCKKGFEKYADFGNNRINCKDIDECTETDKCPDSYACENTPGSYNCVCPANHAEEYGKCLECERILPCGEHSSICTPFGTQCHCDSGYSPANRTTSVLRCQDIDECKQKRSLCGTNALCKNTDGSYRCVCKTGYETRDEDHSLCHDVDECNSSPGACGVNGECINEDGSYQCKCRKGFMLSTENPHECEDIDECNAMVPCGSEEVCTNTIGSYVCGKTHTAPAYNTHSESHGQSSGCSCFFAKVTLVFAVLVMDSSIL